MKIKLYFIAIVSLIFIGIYFNSNEPKNINELESMLLKETPYGKGIKIFKDQQDLDKYYVTILIKSESLPDLGQTYSFFKKYTKLISKNKLDISGMGISIIYKNKNYGIIMGNKFFNKYSDEIQLGKFCNNLSYLGKLSETCTLSPAWFEKF